MPSRNPQDCSASYVVALTRGAASADELRPLADYLSTMRVAGCDVVVIDPSSPAQFEDNSRVLRWVARHVPLTREHCSPSGAIDPIRAAAAVAACEKVIVAGSDVRYTSDTIEEIRDLLELHEVVEPQEYFDPLPWWGGIDAGRILLHRAIEPQIDHAATFAFRRSLVAELRHLGSREIRDDQPRRLSAAGAEVFTPVHLFVRRQPGTLREWVSRRARRGGDELTQPLKNAFFFSLPPLLLLLAYLGGAEMAGGYAGVIAFASVALALRGRVGARRYFPLRACLFAPVWVFERSLGIYWAVLRKFTREEGDSGGPLVPERASGEKRASGQ